MEINKKIEIIEKGSNKFPKSLYDLKDCPKKLYAIGNIDLLNSFSIAIVGARLCEQDSKMYARKISYNIAKEQITIVSGLAKGIDSSAHEACLEAGGKTIAVLGGGFNNIYPKENENLYKRIIMQDGLVISEYSPEEKPLSYHFLRRNRIVAGLSKGVVLIEAKRNSGSLTTAKYAKSLNRKVFVLPGAASNFNYSGSNDLLVNGANCILTYRDVLSKFSNIKLKKTLQKDFEKEKIENQKNVPEEYKKIYSNLSKIPKTINQISIEVEMPISKLTSKLLIMEMDGYIKQLPGKKFLIKEGNENYE